MNAAFIVKKSEKKEKELDNLLCFVMSSIGEAVIVIDLNTNVLFMNNMAEKLTGYSKVETYGKSIFEFFDVFNEESGTRLLSGKMPESDKKLEAISTLEAKHCISLRAKDGKQFSIFSSISVVKNDDNETIGHVIITADNLINCNLQEKQVEYMKIHDALTGSHNRNWFELEYYRKEAGFQAPVALFVCDVDGLKMINDTLGHKNGDTVLIETVKVLKKSIPEKGMIARIGGDEFVILLPRSSTKEAEEVCQMINQKIYEYNNKSSKINTGPILSVSKGFAVSDSLSANISSLFKEADKNMYKEKLHNKKSFRGSILNTVLNLARARDYISEAHSERLSNLIELLALSLRLPEDRINDLRLFAKFHDIGKVGIADGILLKSGVLTQEERENMQRHCEIGYHIAAQSPGLSHIAHWILKHHEMWNGDGYPLGLKEQDIPIECRILSVVDAYGAMTNDRPYRKAISKHEALAELENCAGTQFDPQVVLGFIQVSKALKIYAASSMHPVMRDIEQAYNDVDDQNRLFFQFDASGTLVQCIKRKAIVDVFLSAGTDQMDELQKKELIINDSRKDFVRNKMALISSKNSKLTRGFNYLVNKKIKRIAIGNPEIVPAGKYAQELLRSLGILESIKHKLLLCKNVYQVLNFVEEGYVDVAISYKTDAVMSDKVKIIDWAPVETHSDVVYSVAILKETDNRAGSKDFIEFLLTNKRAKDIFEQHGFEFS